MTRSFRNTRHGQATLRYGKLGATWNVMKRGFTMRRWSIGVFALCAIAPVAQAQRAGASSGTGLTGGSFVAIRVADVDMAAEWYGRTFGLEEVKRIKEDARGFSIRILSGPNLSVELIQQRDVVDRWEPHLGLFKVGFYVTDVEAFHERLAGLGVDVDPQVFVDDALGVRSFVFRDVEGNRLQVFQECGASC